MSSPVIPEVLWAQRSSADDLTKNVIYLTINAFDCVQDSIKIDLQPTGLTFDGVSKAYTFHLGVEFYAEIDVAESTCHKSTRGVEFVLRKKEAKAEFWPRLLKDSKKQHFLKTDFDKWVDEDEQEEAAEDPMAGMGGGMGGMGGMEGMGGMGGMEGMGGFGGIDFSKLGGGAPDAGGDLDDEDMPELEGGSTEDPEATEGEAKTEGAKIEEVVDSK